MRGADLRFARLESADFSNVNLRDAQLDNATGTGTFSVVRLEDARLPGADFELENTSFIGANFTGAALQGARIPLPYRGVFAGADATGAVLGLGCCDVLPAMAAGAHFESPECCRDDVGAIGPPAGVAELAALAGAFFNTAVAALSTGDIPVADLGATHLAIDQPGLEMRDQQLGLCAIGDWSGARLQGSDLSRCLFGDPENQRPANLRDARLQGARIGAQGASDFTLAKLQRSDLQDFAHVGAIFIGADLRQANLNGADLSTAVFAQTDLTGALPANCAEWPAGFDPSAAGVLTVEPGADLSGVDLADTHLAPRWKSPRCLSFAGVTLFQADLSGAILSELSFDGADLREADLSGARLWRASFFEADLTGADLRGADLSLARDFYGAERAGALFDATTICPDLQPATADGCAAP